MENLNNDVFGFGSDTNEELEQTNEFDYSSISGLGQSDYENEDLFNEQGVQTDLTENELDSETDYRIGGYFDSNEDLNQDKELFTDDENYEVNETELEVFNNEVSEDDTNNLEEEFNVEYLDSSEDVNVDDSFENEDSTSEEYSEADTTDLEENFNVENLDSSEDVNVDDSFVNEDLNNEEYSETDNSVVEEETVEDSEETDETVINMSETPIEELNKLTEYEKEEIEQTDINALFDKVSVNVKDASDIFRKNTDLKQKIDKRFEELKKLQSEIENSRNKQLDEINDYKSEVLNKLTEKKEEIEKRLNLLKESQAALEKERKEFEDYRKKEQGNIDRVQKEVQAAYDDRREELGHIEDMLRKQKDALDEERSQLSLDKIQYEADKNELANNLLKFNELVNSFTNGVSNVKE